MNNATMGAAVLGGYLLGRTKKAKLALGIGALLAGSRVRPGQLGKALDAPFLSDLTRQVRSELAGAGKAAATSVLSSKADNLADALHERTAGLRERAEGNGAHDDEADDEPEDTTDTDTDADTDADADADAENQGEAKAGKSGGSGSRSGRRSASQSRSTARPKKKTAAASRAKSASGTRSRRQDDG
ncbi:ABC transporter substrate-binding protein [Streptomyces sp. ATCC 21386]|uniref:ABC transporter substrate-binding protein n=1 Tax=Streptomyces sp. ATCC 21386 TaxID=2699428 RepID=UPI001BFF1013|nr:ABC transporter substrate-binding protein [Streptomyces sp. ATCC 21386]